MQLRFKLAARLLGLEILLMATSSKGLGGPANASPGTEAARVDRWSPPLPADYESGRACDKQNYLWQERSLPARHSELPPLRKLDGLGLIFSHMGRKLGLEADETPPHWQKPIHPIAAVAAVRVASDEYRREARLIGRFVTTTDFGSSEFGNARLFFQHEKYAGR